MSSPSHYKSNLRDLHRGRSAVLETDALAGAGARAPAPVVAEPPIRLKRARVRADRLRASQIAEEEKCQTHRAG